MYGFREFSLSSYAMLSVCVGDMRAAATGHLVPRDSFSSARQSWKLLATTGLLANRIRGGDFSVAKK